MGRLVFRCRLMCIEGDVHVSGTGATRVVDSGSSYQAHVPKPAVQNPYRPAPVSHQPLYRPVHHAPVHREVHVSGRYKQAGDVHVSGAGATRVVDSGSHHRYQPAPVMYNPQPDLPAPVVHKPYVPARPAFLFRRARSVPDHQEDVHVSGSYEQENEVHVSGRAGTTVILDYDDDHSYGGHSSYAHEPASEYESPHAPADDVNVSGSYKQEREVHVSGAGATRVSDSTNSYEHAPAHEPEYEPAVHEPAPAHNPAPAPAYDSAHVQQQETVDVHVSDADVHVSDADVHVSGAGGSVSVEEFNHSSYEMPADDQPAAGQVHQSGHYAEYNAEPTYQPFEPVVIPYSEDLVPAYDMYADHYEAHVPTLYHDEHYVAEDNDIETFYES